MNAIRDLRESVRLRLEAVGCSVHATGPLDFIVGAKGETVVVGIEQPGLPDKPRRWGREARDFQREHRGFWVIVHSAEEAIQVIEAEVGILG